MDSMNERFSGAHASLTGSGLNSQQEGTSPNIFQCPLTEGGSMCFSGCQDCLAVQCKQIAAFKLSSQHLTSPVIPAEGVGIHHLQPCSSSCDADVERTDSRMEAAHCTVTLAEVNGCIC